MSALDTPASISSRAATLLGSNAFDSLTDETVEAFVASQHYQAVKRAVLCEHPWGFAQTDKALVAISGPNATRYAYRYALPADFLVARSLRPDDWIYEVRGDAIVTDARENVVLEYTRDVPETDLPPYFLQALVVRLAAEFAMPLTRKPEIAEYFAKLYEQEAGKARWADSQAYPCPKLSAVDEFIAVRYS